VNRTSVAFLPRAALVLGLALPVASASMIARADEPTAVELSDQAYTRYEAGDYPSAVALYMKAYALNVDSRILFNVAQIYDRKVQDRDLAIEYYRRYLKSTTTEVELVRKATERVTELQRQIDDKQKLGAAKPPSAPPSSPPPGPQASPAPSAPTPPPPTPSPPYWAGYLTGGLLAAGGVVTGALALSASSSLRGSTYAGATPPADLDSTASRSRALGVTTDVLIGGAVVATVVTLIVQVSSSKGAPKASTGARPSGAGLVWRF
jgi:hypothetical protein